MSESAIPVKIEVAPRSIPLSNTGDVALTVKGSGGVYQLPVGAAVAIPPGKYEVIANHIVIARIDYHPKKFDVTPEHEVKHAQFGVYVNLLNLN